MKIKWDNIVESILEFMGILFLFLVLYDYYGNEIFWIILTLRIIEYTFWALGFVSLASIIRLIRIYLFKQWPSS